MGRVRGCEREMKERWKEIEEFERDREKDGERERERRKED